MKIQTCAVAWFCTFMAVASSAGDDSRRVGKLGHPSRLAVEGAKTFSADEIRDELFDDLDIVAASEKNAPLQKLKALIAEKIVGGYHCAGFPDTGVTVAVDDNHLKVTIYEGDRFTNGDVRVIGARAIDAERIKKELTPPDIASGKRAWWPVAKHASFNTEFVDWLSSKIADVAADQGYYRAKLKVVIEPDRSTKTATLNLVVLDEGEPATLGDIEFTGNEMHSRDELLSYLAVDPQQPLTRELRQRLERRLRLSGRFLSVGWKLGEPANRDGDWRPRLSLAEYALAPPLNEPLTREEAALLKLVEWVENFHESDQELIVRVPRANITMIFAPRRGLLVLLEPPREAPAQTAPAGFLKAMAMAEERIGLYSLSQRRKLDAAPPPTPLVGNATLVLIDGGKSLSGRGSIMAGIGLRSATSSARRHVQMRLNLTASAALSVVRTHEAKTDWEGDVVCFEWMHRRMRVNSLTGQLIEYIVDKAEGVDGTTDADDPWTPHITVGSGQFERRLAEIEKASAEWPNAADGRRPLSAVGEFVCEELKHLDAKSERGYEAIGKLLAHGFAAPFDELICQACQPHDEGFAIPFPYFWFKYESMSQMIGLLPKFARAWGIPVGNRLFSRESWMNSIWQSGVSMLAARRNEAADDLSAQPAENRGVICAWASAEILHAAGLDSLSQLCARRGLRRLPREAFDDDCSDVLSDGGLVGKSLLQMTSAARQLDADDRKALVELLTRLEVLDGPHSALLEQCLAALCANGEKSPVEDAIDALNVLWAAGLSDWMQQRLEYLMETPWRPLALGEHGESDDVGQAIPSAYAAPPQSYQPKQGGEFEGYGPADPGKNQTRYSTPDTETAKPGLDDDMVPSPDGGKSLTQEVRELKWLAREVADRLQSLEESLQPSIVPADADDHGSQSVEYVPRASTERELAIELSGPKGLMFAPEAPPGTERKTRPIEFPFTIMLPAQFGRLRVAGVAGREKEPFYVWLKPSPSAAEKLKALDCKAVPLAFNQDDLLAVLQGETVVSTVYLVTRGGETTFETSSKRTTGKDAIPFGDESARGDVVLTVCVSKDDSLAPRTLIAASPEMKAPTADRE